MLTDISWAKEDMEPPGPSSKLCLFCESAVRPRQDGLQCDTCDRWQHRTCKTGMTRATYRNFVKAREDFSWNCSDCPGVSEIPQISPSPLHDDLDGVKTPLPCDARDLELLVRQMYDEEISHPFLQQIAQTKGSSPSVILYTDEQMRLIYNVCSLKANEPSVIGITKPLNVGTCYVTSLVFRNNNLLRKETRKSPIMLGPVFLHWDRTFLTYHHFFIDMMAQMDVAVTGIQIASTLTSKTLEEKALTKAVKHWFPSVTRVTDNNTCCASMNSMIKRIVDGKKLKLPDLVELLYREVRVEHIDARRALHGMGNYVLAPGVARFTVSHCTWVGMSEEQKAAYYQRFLKGKACKHIKSK